MPVDVAALAPRERYKLPCAAVIPRPGAWVTTQDAAGLVTAAPFSFFNVFGENPALVVLGLQRHSDGAPKDTTRNIRRSGEPGVNIATPDQTDALVATAAAYPPGQGEPAALDLATGPSTHVAPPRLACAAAALERRRLTTLAFDPGRELLVAQVPALHARDAARGLGRELSAGAAVRRPLRPGRGDRAPHDPAAPRLTRGLGVVGRPCRRRPSRR
jgi:flavin reductase (DIM6/NTAB) family NADH-FMN oxidoreductase RutF